MKCIIFITILNCFLNSSALPLKMLRPLPLTDNLMYVQYVQPQKSGGIRTHFDSHLLRTESFSKDCAEDNITATKKDSNVYASHDPEKDTTSVGHYDDQNNYDIYDKNNASGVYPKIEFHQTGIQQSDDSEIMLKDEIDEKIYIDTETPQFSTTTISYEEKPIKNKNEQNLNRSSVLNTEAYYPPKKEVYVDMEYPNVDDGYLNTDYLHQKNVRKPDPTNKSDTSVGLPIGTYFPLQFGDSSGNTIAIANSFSTGSGGSAVSHAIAYGNPNSGNGFKRGSLQMQNKF